MFQMQRAGRVILTTNVEDWMADQEYSEVFNFSDLPYTEDEMEITRILDSILGTVLNHLPYIDQTVAELKTQNLIQGRVATTGEQSLGAASGNVYDRIFKDHVRLEMQSGRLMPFANRLEVVERGEAGPDIFMHSGCMIAWDVTSRGDIQKHIDRDVYGRAFNRYYLLIWDSPRMESTRLIREIERNRGTAGR